MRDIGSRRGWIVPPFSTGYRTPEFRSHAPGYPGQEPATGNFCHGNIPPLPFRAALTPRHRGHLSNHAKPSLTLPRSYIPVVLNDQVFGSCAWRSSSRPSCHPIREGGIFLLTHDSDGETGTSTKRERSSAEELARAYIDDALLSRTRSYAYACVSIVHSSCFLLSLNI